MKWRIAVVGASHTFGHEILQILAEREFPVSEVFALDQANATGADVSFGDDETLVIKDVNSFRFEGNDIVFLATTADDAAHIAPKVTNEAGLVIDLSSCFRLDPDVPLIVPEVNAPAIKNYDKKAILASPAAMVTMVAMALKPLHDAAIIKRIVITTFESVSALGREAMDELFTQTRAIYVNDPVEKVIMPKQIAFNVIPQTSAFMEDGVSFDEWSLRAELKKLLGAGIHVGATCVRAPVFIGSAAAITLELEKPLTADEAKQEIKMMRGISLVDHASVDGGYVTPAELAGEDNVFVSRVREDSAFENGLSLWVCGDNLRKGVALNAVQIAERLIKTIEEE